jgi:hypothetical protein
MSAERKADLDRMTAAAEARLDAREDPLPIVVPPPPTETVLSDLRMRITHVAAPEGDRIGFATLGPEGEVPLAHALPVLLRDSATAIVQLAANGAKWPPAVFHAAKTVANAFAAMETEFARMRVSKAAAELKAKGVS